MITVPKFFNTAGPIQSDIHYNVDPFQRIVLELKILRSNIEETIRRGLEQTTGYMDQCGDTINEGHFILFDRRPGRPWDEKIWHRTEHYNGRVIEVWGNVRGKF